MLRCMSFALSTSSVRPSDKLAYWADLVCRSYVQLDCEPGPGQELIEGEIRAGALASLRLSRVTASAQTVTRTPARIAGASEDFFLVSIQAAGTGTVLQDGRAARLSPGDFALYDSTRPYQLVFGADFQQYVLMLPGPLLRAQLGGAQRLTAQTVAGQKGAGHLMIGMIRSLWASLDELEPASAAAVAESVEHILLAGLRTLPVAGAPAGVSHLTAYHREQIKDCIRRRLRDPQLGVDEIARETRLSVSSLHRVFSGEGESLSDYLWRQRLEAVRRELLDPASQGRRVSEIAYAWGFNDAAHFSRAFKARFGCSPTEFRERYRVAS